MNEDSKDLQEETLNDRILSLFGYRCIRFFPGCDWGAATTHHIKPRSLFPELADDPENLAPACRPCHEAIHEDTEAAEPRIRSQLKFLRFVAGISKEEVKACADQSCI